MKIQNPEEVIVSPVLETEEKATLAYWTEARMAAAEPLPIPVQTGPKETVSGEPHVPEDENSRARPKYATSLVEDTTVFPYQCVGKLYFVQQGKRRVCSAYVIGQSTIGTAAHCLYRHGQHSEKIVFRARYNNGAHAGRWGIKQTILPEDWKQTETRRYDMALGITYRPIAPITGKLKWIAKCQVEQNAYTQIGYPAESIPDYPFDGKRMWKTVTNDIRYQSANGLIRAGGNMTKGCSGGPWVVFKDGHWRVNGISVYRPKHEPDYLYSPYFGDEFMKLIKRMKDSGGD